MPFLDRCLLAGHNSHGAPCCLRAEVWWRRALRLLGTEDSKWKSVKLRCCRYLNNVIEQDHRAIKRRCASMLGLKSFKTVAITFTGIELANRIRKGQYSLGRSDQGSTCSLKHLWARALAPSSGLDTPQHESPVAHPPMHQNSRTISRSKSNRFDLEPIRHARKIAVGRGLYLLVTPNGRYWRYNYRFKGKHKHGEVRPTGCKRAIEKLNTYVGCDSRCLGRSIVNTHPRFGTSRTPRTPLFASTPRWQMANPSPNPDRSLPTCLNGLNISSAAPGSSPPQWSSTSIRMRSAAA